MRVCFQLQVKQLHLEEYRRRHAAVWPDMLAALSAASWDNYSLFLRDDGLLIGYFETPSLEDALSQMQTTAVNARWQMEMADFFEGIGDTPADQAFQVLDEIFHLEDQLATQQATTDDERKR